MLKGVLFTVITLFTASVCQASPLKGDRAPDFKALTSAGVEISLAEYRGKIVVLDFFATWCAPCRQLTSFLVELEKKSKGSNLKIIGMDVEDSGKEKITAYIREKGINYPLVYAQDNIQSLYGVRSLPLLYIVGKDGTIAGKFQGFNGDIAASIESLLKRIQ